MTDYFALLDEPRCPWIDPEALKTKFLALSSALHPDRVHAGSTDEKNRANERYTQLNAAYRCLHDPKERLAHLLQLETGTRPVQVHSIPPQTAELFIQVSQLCREVDSLLGRKRKQTSPLLRAQLFSQALPWTEKLQAIKVQLEHQRTDLLRMLETFNPAWENAPPIGSPERVGALPLQPVEQIYRSLSYINRWTAQIQERLVELAF